MAAADLPGIDATHRQVDRDFNCFGLNEVEAMADSIIYRGPLFVVAATDEWGPAIPYRPEIRGNGESNHGFFDLRDSPRSISDIPEARKSRALVQLLEVANSSGSPLLTLGCECGCFPASPGASDDMVPYVGGYVDLAFRDPAANQKKENLTELASTIVKNTFVSMSWLVAFEFLVQPLPTFFGATGCFCLEVKSLGFGKIPDESWSAFELATTAITAAVRSFVSEQTC